MRPRGAAAWAVAALALTFGLPGAGADHVEVNSRTFPTGACERLCIPAIVEPRFTDEPYLDDAERVIGLALQGDARAYPIQVLVWHEIVNDVVGGEPVAVTYCPLCGSSLVYERTVRDQVLTLQTSGRLFRSDLVMLDDETRSLWPQILGEAVDGPLHGERLQAVTSTITTWGDWRAAQPATKLLARPLCSDWPYAVGSCPTASKTFARTYGRDPYAGYDQSRAIGIFGEELGDIQGLHPKAMVVGAVLQGQAKAWPEAAVAEARVLVDDVLGIPVVLTFRDGGVRAFHREPGQSFEPLDATRMQDGEGIAWDLASGVAEDGRELARVTTTSSFWFAWLDFHQGTLLFDAARVVAQEPAAGAPLAPQAAMVLRFSDAMDRASVEASLTLDPPHAHTLAWDDDRTLRIEPAEPWREGRTYTVRLGGQSQDGLDLAPAEHRFRVAGGLPAGFEDPGIAPGLGVLFGAALLLVLVRKLRQRRG